jgi:hypothetical protein
MSGHYEVHDCPAAGQALKAIVWAEPGRPPLIMTTITAERIPALAEALTKYLAASPPATSGVTLRIARRLPGKLGPAMRAR